MYSSIHSKFITTSLCEILKDGVNACSGIGDNIETFSLCDYVFQSLFLKMTGAQEQKLKCICWELASNDYEFRYEYLSNVKIDYGEFSRYKQKNNVYLQLLNQIRKKNESFKLDDLQWLSNLDEERKKKLIQSETEIMIHNEIIKQKKLKDLTTEDLDRLRRGVTEHAREIENCLLIKAGKRQFPLDIKNKIKSILDESVLSISLWRDYTFWSSENRKISYNKFALSDNILNDDLIILYDEDVIKHRHRCAHNLTSYQQNLPSLNTLSKSEYIYFNYFYRFNILILIDEIFIRLYKEYIETLNYCTL